MNDKEKIKQYLNTLRERLAYLNRQTMGFDSDDEAAEIRAQESTMETIIEELEELLRENKKLSLVKMILSEDVSGLAKFDQFSQDEDRVKQAAKTLQDLVAVLQRGAQEAINKAGPFAAEQLLDAMKEDINSKMKEISIPQSSNLSNIMRDVSAKEKELQARDAEKAASKTAPAAKEKPAVAAPPPPEEKAGNEEGSPATPAVTAKTPHKKNIKVP